MSTMLMELMHHLQDVHTHYPNDGTRVIVAVPTTPHAVEEFEVGEVHQDGPSVILHCQPLQNEQAIASRMNKPSRRMNKPSRRMNKPAPLRKKPGIASITTTRTCSDEVGRPGCGPPQDCSDLPL